ncbi:MAG: MFS transporter [Oscillospiraceae bacterium]
MTRLSCYVGIFVQAIVCNITAILFIPMMDLYGFSYVQLGTLVAVNFTAQVAVDIIFSGMIDKFGYRKIALPAIFCGFIGLVLFAASPLIFDDVFLGIVISTVIFAASSGLLEIMVSPIANSLPSANKGASMSLMHSFYAWGQVATIIITTLFIFIFGGKYWQIIVLFWSIVPLINFFMFAKSPFPKTVTQGTGATVKKIFFQPFYIIALLAIFFGAGTELVLGQWSSSFMEKALELPKLVGDMLGMCGFALMMAFGRTFYGIKGAQLKMSRVLILGSAISLVCYVTVALSPVTWINVLACAVTGLASSLLWPGTLVISASRFPLAGAWMFAILAAAGDIGGAFAPWLTGVIVDYTGESPVTIALSNVLSVSGEQAGMRLGILVAALFPLLAMICHITLNKMFKKAKEKEICEE